MFSDDRFADSGIYSYRKQNSTSFDTTGICTDISLLVVEVVAWCVDFVVS